MPVATAQPPRAFESSYHRVQRDLMADYFREMTEIAESGSRRAVHLLIAGNPVELIRAFDLLPVYPEVNALQLAAKKSSLPYILKAEELGYSTDNCAYVKADIGLYFSGRQAPFATIPEPGVILCNFVGCQVYLHWFEHLAEYTQAPAVNIDIPFIRTPDGEPTEADIAYTVRQLEELVALFEEVSGQSFDYQKFQRIVALSGQTGELWSAIKHLTKNRPAPFDAYFDAATMMAPLYCLRGTERALRFFELAYKELSDKADRGEGPLPEEKVRYVIEGPPPWPYLRQFRELFSRWGAVAVASTYSTVGGLWEFGFSHDPQHPFESIARHMLKENVCNRNFLQRYQQIGRYADEWGADALVIHSVKSCRLFSAGQGDMREYFTRERSLPTLLIESDLEDPRYYSQAQLQNRIDAFFESIEHRKLTHAAAVGGA
jgi:benzoyl-CoA reductase subunit B